MPRRRQNVYEKKVWLNAKDREFTDEEAAALGRFLWDLWKRGLGPAIDETFRAIDHICYGKED